MAGFSLCSKQHIIDQAEFIPSPYCDQRPSGQAVELLVVHCISLPPAEFGGGNVQKLFTGKLDLDAHPYYRTIPTYEVSSHLFIDRNGHLIQFVPFNKRAWHAGKSTFDGKERCNDFSIGIELEGTEQIPYTAAQYQCLVKCTALLMEHYPGITMDSIVGHSDIAPSRKTDPGPSFDWPYFRQQISQTNS